MEQYLQLGDIVEIQEGMSVYIQMKERYFDEEYPLSDEMIERMITIGEKISPISLEKTKAVMDYAVHNFFQKMHITHLDTECMEVLTLLLKDYQEESIDTSSMAGKYVVTNTNVKWVGFMYKVTLKKMLNNTYDPNGNEIFIYQNADNAIIRVETLSLKPIGTMPL